MINDLRNVISFLIAYFITLQFLKMQSKVQSTKKPIVIPKYAEKYKSMIQQSQKTISPSYFKTQQESSTSQSSSLSKPSPKSFFFYKIKSIGVGAHSFVYLVQQEQSKMLLAEKSITIEHAKSSKNNLFQQIKILSFTQHENIIKLYHFYRNETHLNLVMQFAEDSLFHLKQKFIIFKEKQIIQVLRQLLNGLNYLHKKCIVHADVKIQNIMIANGTIKLCDFGYAHKYDENKILDKQQIVGTMQYLSPQYANGKDSGYKRDIWAVGIIAFEMLVGKNPFEGLKQNEKWTKLIKSGPEIYLQQMKDHEKLMGVNSEKINQLVKHIFCEQQVRWSASDLLKLQFMQPTKK